MRYTLCALCALIMMAPCVADEGIDEAEFLLLDAEPGELTDTKFDFAVGVTTVSHDNYRVRITAEQRRSDYELLVISFPREEGVIFDIHRVELGRAPRHNLQGIVAKVFGTFRARVNQGRPIVTRMMVPVEIAPVNEFTVSSNEALVQGNRFITKKLPKMVTGNSP